MKNDESCEGGILLTTIVLSSVIGGLITGLYFNNPFVFFGISLFSVFVVAYLVPESWIRQGGQNGHQH